MVFPVTGKYLVSQSDATLTNAYGKITFNQAVRQICVINDGNFGESDVYVSFDGTNDYVCVKAGDSWCSDPLLDGWIRDLWVKSSAAVLIPNYRVMSMPK